MCELKVAVVTPSKNEHVAEDVIFAQVENGHVILRDVLGTMRTVPDALISNVDISKEALSLVQSPIVGPFLRFLDACNTAEVDGNCEKVEETWNDLKAEGDQAVRSLWRARGRSS